MMMMPGEKSENPVVDKRLEIHLVLLRYYSLQNGQ